MELKLKNGDYVPDGMGGLQRVEGQEELLQRVVFKLTARRGKFPFDATLGSRLWQLGSLSAQQRQSAAAQYVAEALEGEPLSVEAVELTPKDDGTAELKATLLHRGDRWTVALDIRV